MVVLKECFDKSYEDIINSNKSLANWFLKNQEALEYFNLTSSDCLHFEETNVSNDIKVLGRIAHSLFTILESNNEEDKALRAVQMIHEVLEVQKDLISRVALEAYSIDISDMYEYIEAETGLKRRKTNI